MANLTGKIALVTGSDSGIGRASAIALAKAGADIVVTYHKDSKDAEETKEQIEAAGRRAIIFQTDVSDPKKAEALFNQSVEYYGTVDILVNNAGINGAHKQVADMAPEEFENTLRTNLLGPFYLCRMFVQHKRKHGGKGKIINVSSIHEEVVQPGTADYCASKGGLRNFMRALSMEVAAEGINVNNVCPGLILTPINQPLLDDPQKLREAEQRIPMKRAAQPEEVASLVVFLASEEADYITGSSYVMDGGFTLAGAQGA